jgi:HEAT repeats
LHGTALLLSFSGSIWILVLAFSESLSQGLLCLLVPCYVLFYIFSRWEDTRGAFVLELLPVANLVAFFAIGLLINVAAQGDDANNVAKGEAQPNVIPGQDGAQAAIDPQPGFGPPPGFGQAPGFGQPPALGPPPAFGQPTRFGPPPGFGPRRGRRGFGPGIPQFQPPAHLDPTSPQFQAQFGAGAVYLTFSGLPTNSDPAQGVTVRDVSEAIRNRARELAPTANRFSWMSRGNTAVLTLAPVDDIPGFASRIDFGTTAVSGNQIKVQISPAYVASVARLPAEPSAAAGDTGRPGRASEPEFPPDADAATRSLIQLKWPETRTKKDGLNRLMRTTPDERLAEVVQAVLPLLDDDDGWLVGDAIKVLVIWKSPDAVPALIKLTTDNRFTVRHEAIKALGKIKDPRGAEPVILRIQEDGFQAEDALKEMGPIAEQALIERLTNPDSGIRRRVCNILKVVGGKETLKAMQSLPADPDFSVRVAAKDAIGGIVLRVGPLSAAERQNKAGGSATPRRGRSQ